jgi:TonB family protein
MTSLLVATLAMAAQVASPTPPDCARLLTAEPGPGIAPLCQAEEATRAQRLGEAAALYERAAELLNDLDLKIYAYEAVVRLYDATHLDDPPAVERALRQLATIVAGTPAPLMRLATFQETHAGLDRAELTLLGARQQYPESHPLLSELSAFFARRVMAMQRSRTAETGGPAESPASGEAPAYRPDCQQFSFGHPASGLAQLCVAEAAMRQAAVPPAKGVDPAERARLVEARKEQLRKAAEHYARAAGLLDEVAQKVFAYEALARVHGRTNLNEPRLAEQAIRQVIALRPYATEPIIRLAAIQEEQTLVDAAEGTLLSARQQFPEDVEPLKALSRFYARLATAAGMAANRREREAEAPRAPGQPDENGFYSVGGPVPPPKKVQDIRPEFPQEARAVDLSGIVIFELFLDDTGAVIDARPTRPIPMLDEAAMAAVKQWRFQPTIVDGRPVPARLTVTVNFTLQKQ